MEIKDIVERLGHSTEFSKWKKEHADSFFADAFMIVDDENKSHWQLGYYDKATNKITVFVMEPAILVKEPEEVFKRDRDKVLEIDLDKIKVDADAVSKMIKETCVLHYPAEKLVKSIFVLQNIKQRQVWNITNITESFKTINIKIDTETGKVVEHKIVSLFEFSKK